MTEPKITFAPNGPILVKGEVNLKESSGKITAKNEMTALCRCGASKNKPFCDGAHSKIEFSDACESDGSKNHIQRFESDQVIVRYNKELCSHAAHCSAKLPQVFKPGETPWITPNEANPEEVIATVKKCPSGALAYEVGGQVTKDFDRAEPNIEVAKDGPYYVGGSIPLEGATIAKDCSNEHYALCRCGQSRNKPFCDGYHYDIDFKAD